METNYTEDTKKKNNYETGEKLEKEKSESTASPTENGLEKSIDPLGDLGCH